MRLCEHCWSDRNIDIDKEEGLGKAIAITDSLFKENKLYGFDIFEDGEDKFLASHYQ